MNPVPNPEQNLVVGQNYTVVSNNGNFKFTGTLLHKDPNPNGTADFQYVQRMNRMPQPRSPQEIVTVFYSAYSFYGKSATNASGGKRRRRQTRRRRITRRRR